MEQPRWQSLEAAKRGLVEIEHSMSGGEFFASYLDKFKAGGQAQCTTVWTKTTIAYRCRTCQVNDSSAICVSCFQAGDHRHHDYVMYHSDSGGCCDCGDHAAWKEEGFCSVHRSSSLHKELTIPAHLNEITSKAVEFVLKELCIWVEMIMTAKTLDHPPPSPPFRVPMAEIYVKWLQKICSVASLRNIVVEEITNARSAVALMVQNDKTRNRSFLEILLSTYGRMPDSLMEAETTLFLQMLYDQQFKDTFSRALMRHYAGLIEPAAITRKMLGEYKALDQSLDRVMVQLFNVPEITLNLIQTDRLLESFTSVLDSVLSQCTNRRVGTVDVDHHAIRGKVYGRPQGDLKLIVAHESVALHVLKERPDVFRNILSTLSLLQWMNPYSRSETVGIEGQESWRAAITLEMNTMTIPFGLIGRCFSGFPGNEEVKSALISAACVSMFALREFLTKVETYRGSEEKLSLHIPLHRVFAAVISKLVMLPWGKSGQGFLENLQPGLTEAEVLALMDHPLRVVVWMAEIRARMWQSSDDFSRLELIYRGSIWHDQSMDMDILMLQFCCVARENMGQCVISMMAQKFGLLEMVSTMPMLDAGGENRESILAKISMLQDFLRLLLLIIRERRNTGMFEKESLRYDVIQWLCVRDQTYSQTFKGLPTFQDLMAMVKVAYVLATTQASVAFNKLSGDDNTKLVEMDKAKIEVLQVACLPFLRRVALIVQVIAQKETRELASGQAIEWMESEGLQQWLDLPKIQEAVELGMQGIHGVKMQQLWQNNQPAPLLYKVPRQAVLTTLPEVFQELVLQNLKVACLNCHKIPNEPAICLVCGNLFCCGTDCCNIDGMGECYRHADKESAGIGIYLLIRSTQLVLLRSNRVCMAPSLYLDLHGEEDAYLKRGHPLHLCHLRLNEVRRLWLTASFDHETHILHSSQIGGRVL